VDPENALAWARLAELQASFGYLTQSVESAEKAVALDPNVSRTQTVLGFANLTKVRTQQAKEAFEKAIKLDQADPLPRLGLGLAMIRRGDLEGGRAEIEIAASLDPNNSLIRSYLGKAFFEEKRTDLDGPEFKIAKELDPKDPTPFFYDAIRKQTINRPVEALRDFQKAIELNDNRAVFRSQLKLDSDEAARSSSLARIYSDLGFQELALVEGWKAVNIDPANHSAHRFLADSYSARPRHEIARVSELLQSQLLQPINTTPIQPRLAESNLFLISSGGPGSLSFNEFNPIFNRNGANAQFSVLAGENDTIGGEFTVAAIQNRLSWSFGYTLFDTDGWRENNDQEDKIANAFVQYELSYKTSIQAEFRFRENERGDIELRFFEDDFRPDRRQEDDTLSVRAGFRHSFSPSSDLIGNFSYGEADRSFFELIFLDFGLPPPLFEENFTLETDEDAYSGELQHLFRSEYVNTVVGGGYFDIDVKREIQDDIFDPFFTPPALVFSATQRSKTNIDHYNVYLYSYLNFLKNVTFTIGASGDFYDEDEKGGDQDQDEDQFNPKFGITWNPHPDTTLRGSAFRTLKRTLITDQTLEPTQVAGFNQFYDDFNATETWHYGAAVDQKFSQNIYTGLQGYYRDLSVPIFNQPAVGAAFNLERTDWDEYVGGAYLYWTPHEWFGLRAEYEYERIERNETFPFGIENADTHKVPLEVNFFHPTGLSARLKVTFYDQEGRFQTQEAAADEFDRGEDNFWLVDAAIRYRFPKRFGFFSLGVTNLFDEDFEFADTDLDNPSIQRDRAFFGSLTLALP
jgi:Tfp pilus assembly protein PilF